MVVGGGNAALCAAITARSAGAGVLLLERSQRWDRGGNSRHTRNIRCARDAGGPAERYTPDEMLDDLRGVTGEELDEDLARLAIERSREVPAWMEAQGIRWQPALHGTLQLDRTNRFFLGGGKALVNTYYRRAEHLGVSVEYGARVEGFRAADADIEAVVLATAAGPREVACRAVVIAAGGFESNLEWLRRYWGDAVDHFVIRGTPHNDGAVLAALLDLGAASRGNERGFHAVAVDARSPRFDGGIVTRVDSIPFGIVVNGRAERFYDEGEDIWPKRYATWGGLIAQQEDQIAYSLFDAKAWGRFIPPLYPPHQAPTIADLARSLGLPANALERTVAAYNAAAPAAELREPGRPDGRATSGIVPAKSNWAARIDAPPYFGYPLRPGITFTYFGLAVDGRARVLRRSGAGFSNAFAAGEIMAGNILRRGYLGGFGMTVGTVFGRIAGEEAARAARA